MLFGYRSIRRSAHVLALVAALSSAASTVVAETKSAVPSLYYLSDADIAEIQAEVSLSNPIYGGDPSDLDSLCVDPSELSHLEEELVSADDKVTMAQAAVTAAQAALDKFKADLAAGAVGTVENLLNDRLDLAKKIYDLEYTKNENVILMNKAKSDPTINRPALVAANIKIDAEVKKLKALRDALNKQIANLPADSKKALKALEDKHKLLKEALKKAEDELERVKALKLSLLDLRDNAITLAFCVVAPEETAVVESSSSSSSSSSVSSVASSASSVSSIASSPGSVASSSSYSIGSYSSPSYSSTSYSGASITITSGTTTSASTTKMAL